MLEYNVSGLLVPPENPEALATAIVPLPIGTTLAARLSNRATAVVADRFSPEV